LRARASAPGDDGIGTGLMWQLNGGSPTGVAVEVRRPGRRWERVAIVPRAARVWGWGETSAGFCYRVRAINEIGESAYSNIACTK
jgi:hypothetical protein